MKTNYMNHYSLRLLLGNILLTLPSLCAVLLVLVWDIDFLMLPPLLGIIGWILVLPLTYTIARDSKERVAIDALACGLLMLCLCSITVSIKYIGLKELSKAQAPKGQGEITKKVDSRDRDSKEEYWGHRQ